MLFRNPRVRKIFTALAIAGSLATLVPASGFAQGLSGLTIFSGVRRENELAYRLDFGGNTNSWDRYRLRIPAKKMSLAAAQFTVTYPDYYKGKFDTDRIEIRVDKKSVPLEEVTWDKENHRVEIWPTEPIPAGSKVEIVFSNVKNPSFGGTFYFNAQIQTPGDVPLLRYLGTWVITIS